MRAKGLSNWFCRLLSLFVIIIKIVRSRQLGVLVSDQCYEGLTTSEKVTKSGFKAYDKGHKCYKSYFCSATPTFTPRYALQFQLCMLQLVVTLVMSYNLRSVVLQALTVQCMYARGVCSSEL